MLLNIVTSHSPNQVVDWLEKYEYTKPKIEPLTVNSTGIILVFGLQTLKQYSKNFKCKARVILFDGPITAMTITNGIPLDVESLEDDAPPYYGLRCCKLNRKAYSNTKPIHNLELSKYCYYTNIIQAVESKSLLNSLMTAIYAVPANAQKQVKNFVIKWLTDGGKRKTLATMLTRLRNECKVSDRSLAELAEILQSEIASKYVQAFCDRGTNAELALKYDISEYDLNYIHQIKKGL